MSRRPTLLTASTRLGILVVAVYACSGQGDGASEEPAAGDADEPAMHDSTNPAVALLDTGQAVFGLFSGDHTPGQGALMGGNREADFVFYSLESGPFDIPAMEAYMRGMGEGAGAGAPQPLVLRIPPIRTDGADSARARARAGLAAGAAGIVFPHVENPEEARVAVESVGGGSWPGNPDGTLLNVLLIEDRVGVAQAAEIAATPGVSVVIPGPGDLRRAYDGDMEAVEGAIQAVLSACRVVDVACGITAGVDDIAERLSQGFRFFILTDPAALAVGREAAGR